MLLQLQYLHHLHSIAVHEYTFCCVEAIRSCGPGAQFRSNSQHVRLTTAKVSIQIYTHSIHRAYHIYIQIYTLMFCVVSHRWLIYLLFPNVHVILLEHEHGHQYLSVPICSTNK